MLQRGGFIFGDGIQIVIACNTAHLLLPELHTRTGLLFESLIDATVEAVVLSGSKTVGILASPTTIQSGLYDKALALAGVKGLQPHDERGDIEAMIRGVMRGDDLNLTAMNHIVENLLERGAERIVLGCTELSVVLQNKRPDVFIDPLDIITEKLLTN